MPLSYRSLKEEHQAVRETAGIFDVSHMGEFIVRGAGARELVQYVTSNDVTRLSPGQAQYSCLPRPEGGIVDDLLVYHLPPNPKMGMNADYPSYMLVVNASNIQKDWDWIQQHNTFGAELLDISDRTALLAVQGPKAAEILQPLTDVDLAAIPYYSFVRGPIAGVDNVIISATGYTGSGGFELYLDADRAEQAWRAILEVGESMAYCPPGSVPAIPYAWKRASGFTATTSTTPPPPSKPVWAGSPSLMERTSWAKIFWSNKRLRGYGGAW